jgi:hypothetical protein
MQRGVIAALKLINSDDAGMWSKEACEVCLRKDFDVTNHQVAW